MEILEFGNREKQKIILIHGFQSPWQVWEKYIEHYKNDFHIIVPVMSGHGTQEKDDFISFSNEAKELEEYIVSKYGQKVYAVFGMSMGGVLAAVLWQNRNLCFEKVIFDGSPLVSINRFLKRFMLNFYLKVTHKTKERDKKTLRQAASICPKEQMEHFVKVLDNMSDATICNALNGIADFKLKSDIDVSQTSVYYFHGNAANEMLAKKTAGYIKKHYPDAVIKCFKGKGHCQVSLFEPEAMTEETDKILK